MIHFNELEKGMVLNKTNLKRIAHVTGSDETDDWTGKQVVIYTDPDVEFGGEIVGGLRIRRKPSNTAQEKVAEMEDDVPF